MDDPSPFLPPRKRWYSGVFSLGYRWQVKSGLDRAWEKLVNFSLLGSAFAASAGVNLLHLVLAMVVPAYGFFYCRRAWLGANVLTGYAIAALWFFIRIGHADTNIPIMAMLGLHVAGFRFILSSVTPRPPPATLLVLTIGAYLIILLGIYRPMGKLVRAYVVLPLDFNQRIVLVNPRAREADIRQGDWVAYQFDGFSTAGLQVQAGTDMEQALAASGDRMRFGPDYCVLNETRVFQATKSGMPKEGEFVVPENHLFIWPSVADSIIGSSQQDSPIRKRFPLEQLAFIPHERIKGRAYESWFGLKQKVK